MRYNEIIENQLFQIDGEEAVGYWYNPRSKKSYTIAWDAADETSTFSDHGDVAIDHPEWFGISNVGQYDDFDTLRIDVVNNGWVRIGYNTTMGLRIDARNPSEAYKAFKWMIDKYGMPVSASIDPKFGDQFINYRISGNDLDEYLSTGRLQPSWRI